MSEHMLEALHKVELALPELLLPEHDGLWNSVDVDYEPPRVERVWRQWGDLRIYLHFIHPCPLEQALFHPHPWESAMGIHEGSYKMLLGYGSGETRPPARHLVILGPGSRYQMTDPDEWHCAAPDGGIAKTVMITGRRFERWSPRPRKPLLALAKGKVAEILEYYRGRYPKP